MPTAGEIFEHWVDSLRSVLADSRALAPAVESLGAAMMNCWNNGGKVLVAGNGGSCADAMHLAEELVVRFNKNRRALPAIAFSDPTMLTCAGNDFGYDEVFKRQIEAFGQPGDLFVAISTSGNSENILRAVAEAKTRGLITSGWIGKTGGKLKSQTDHEIHVPSANTAHVQEVHKVVIHALCSWIDDQVG